MISSEEVEEILPCPVQIKICCDRDVYLETLKDWLREIREEHNEKYGEEIYCINNCFVEPDFLNDNDEVFNFNEYEIYVGREIIQKGKGPDNLFTVDEEENRKFYLSFIPLMKNILESWHDRIIEIQEENRLILEDLEREENYEMLFAYYFHFGNLLPEKKDFHYAKLLSQKYPSSSRYKKILFAYYRGIYDKIRINKNITKKKTTFEEK